LGHIEVKKLHSVALLADVNLQISHKISRYFTLKKSKESCILEAHFHFNFPSQIINFTDLWSPTVFIQQVQFTETWPGQATVASTLMISLSWSNCFW